MCVCLTFIFIFKLKSKAGQYLQHLMLHYCYLNKYQHNTNDFFDSCSLFGFSFDWLNHQKSLSTALSHYYFDLAWKLSSCVIVCAIKNLGYSCKNQCIFHKSFWCDLWDHSHKYITKKTFLFNNIYLKKKKKNRSQALVWKSVFKA